MNKKVAAIWLSFTILVCFIVIIVELAPPVKSSTIYIGGTGPGNYSTIQDGINVAIDGDTVYVYNGTYYENIVVNKKINLTGEDSNITIINGSQTGNVILVIVDWVNITGFTVMGSGSSSQDSGIGLDSVQNCRVFNNNITGNNIGLDIDQSSLINVTGNIVKDNLDEGIIARFSDNVRIEDNNLSNFGFGIDVGYSFNSIVKGNEMTNDGIILDGNLVSHFNTHNISSDNLVNGLPVSFQKDTKDIDIDSMAIGQLILANCSNIKVTNLHINYTDIGIQTAFSSDCLFESNNMSDSLVGISSIYSTNMTVTDNNVTNTINGIFFLSNGNSQVSNNILVNSRRAIYLTKSHNSSISGNMAVKSGTEGIIIGTSDHITVVDNSIYSATDNGVWLLFSENVTVRSNDISHNQATGLSIWSSTNVNVTSNDIFNNTLVGLSTWDATDVIINANIISSNFGGIGLSDSTGVLVYHNNFLNNAMQASDNNGNENLWDNNYPLGGNYWSNYSGVDNFSGPNQDILGADGIGDTNYSIDSDSVDRYPLMIPYLQNSTFLRNGWNLISIPFIQNNDNLNMVLSSINGFYDAVQWYNVSDPYDYWKHNQTNKPPHLNDLNNIHNGMGFWIHLSELYGVLFEYPGTPPISNQTITLHPGWNMVGYPSMTSYNRTKGLNNLTFDNQVNAIWSYDAATQKHEEMGESDYFIIGRGYYIHAKTECEWEVPL
jgi:parallel beta-helix repeat protein